MWLYAIFALFAFSNIPFSLEHTTEAPVVETTLGNIQGSIMKTLKGVEIFAFRGIPYTQPPLGKLRFAAPLPVTPWTDTLKAVRDSLVCPQPGVQALMSEDCLKLNVYSRNLTYKAPVLVYIHGGANVLGSGHSLYEAGPQYLLDQDVVLVAFNYRLGALGFLSTKSKEAPGNYGYLDQVMALKWVQDHIEHFGGDPQQVTIFGLSAGAMAVTLHLASPLSKGLFHHAIAMSGSATNHFEIDNQYWTRKLARELSCPMYNPIDVVECLRDASWKDIINICTNWEPYKFINMKWNYEIDGHFLLEHPTKAFQTKNVNKVPLMIGFTRNELDFSVYHQENNTALINDINVNFGLYAPEMFLYEKYGILPDKDDSRAEKIRVSYLKNATITKDNLQEFGKMFSDGIIGHGVYRLVRIYSNYANVFFYRMDYVGNRGLYTDAAGNPRGVGHADDLQYVMPGLWYGTQLNENSADIFMVHRLTRWFANFAKSGVPINTEDEEWEPCKEGNIKTLFNDKTTHMAEASYQDRYQVWDQLFPISYSSALQFHVSASLLIFVQVLRSYLL